MVEFCGELSDSCKSYVQKSMTKVASFAALITLVVLSIPIIIVTILWHWIVILFLLIPILALIFTSIPKLNSPMKVLNLYLPQKMAIQNGIINIECKKLTQSRPMSAVKKVVDLGEWYQIIFYFPQKSLYFVCQKNLITKGSIEEFEEIFEGKIIQVEI